VAVGNEKTHRNLCRDSRSQSRDFNPELPKYGTRSANHFATTFRPGRQSYLSAPGFPIKFSLLYSKFELSSMSYFIVALVKELTLYPMIWFMDGTPIDSIYRCPTIIQQMLRNRMPCKHVSVSAEGFVTSSFLPLVYSENETSISLLGSETSIITGSKQQEVLWLFYNNSFV
jgi:hypothetical protein